MVVFYACGTRKKNLKYNEVIALPPISQQTDSTQQSEHETEFVNIDTIDLLLIMPFELRENFTMDTSDTFYDIQPGSINAINFYEGAVLAAEDLSDDGLTVNIHALESPRDSIGLSRIERSSMWNSADFVIAELSPSLVPVISRRAKASGKNVLLTQVIDPSITGSNENVMITYASTITQCRKMAEFLVDSFPSSQITLVFRNQKREDYLAEIFRESIKLKNPYQKIKEFDATSRVVEDLIGELSLAYDNMVMIVSSDEAFVSPYISGLNGLENIEWIDIAGLPTWQNFESINFMQFDSLSFYLFENNFIDNNDVTNQSIRKKYIQTYSSDPNSYGYSGYKLVEHIAGNVVNAGQMDLASVAATDTVNTGTDFNFVRTDSTGGYENTSISVLKIVDFRYKPLGKYSEYKSLLLCLFSTFYRFFLVQLRQKNTPFLAISEVLPIDVVKLYY
jgi:hypothetical protein